MTLALLIAGIVAFLAGLLSIFYGISIKEFSLGSTLILGGTIGVCTGMLLAGLLAVVMELRGIARRLAASAAASEVRVRPVLPGLAPQGVAAPPSSAPVENINMDPSPAAPPWQDAAAARERQRSDVAPPPPAPEAPTEPPRKRNLLFQSTSRRERERAQAKPDGLPLEAPTSEPHEEGPPASFEDAWPRPDRVRPTEAPPRRPPPRMPSAASEPAAPPPAPAPQPDQAAVTVLKSGIVDGMAYSLYSDGSIEAQMPEGMMRFASIDELRAHLDQRS
jgi:hypothetical protein